MRLGESRVFSSHELAVVRGVPRPLHVDDDDSEADTGGADGNLRAGPWSANVTSAILELDSAGGWLSAAW